jgi:flagellar biosynthetic protein FliR
MIELYALVLARVSGVLIGAPLFSRAQVDPRVRLLLGFGLALAVGPAAQSGPLPAELGATLAALCAEFAIGLSIGLLARFLLAAFQLAGAVISFQMGFAVANAFDPDANEQMPILATLHLQITALLLLLVDGHHLLLRALAHSYQGFPLGGRVELAVLASSLTGAADALYDLGARVAAPVSGLMLLVNASIGFLNRVVPHLGIFNIGFPMAVLSGLISLVIYAPDLGMSVLRALEQLEAQLAAALGP